MNTPVTDRIPAKERFFLNLQIAIDWLFFPIVGISTILFFRVVQRVKIQNHDELRKAFQRIVRNKRPTLICANHLTMFDSIFIHYALGGVGSYFFDFRTFSWNTPAVEKFKTTVFMRVLTYLGKTIPIDRQGSGEHHKLVLDKIRYLMERGEVCTIFPEGGRSRTGRVDLENVTYGVGNILKDMGDFQVLCIYIRGSKQVSYTVLPPRKDTIFVRLEVLEPRTTEKGLRASRDLSLQIIQKLKEMEDDYFNSRSATESRK